ncbi:hypothetical protein M378DRAFT_11472 [Amanita muscaria Koide BX008]|uniref:Uncharacterized protein n=1 Tax=Amanita muscaria (strain Koide BX008) TaxID=946122 RepID=A0A0C2TCC2_AMAMK|nr:hypothetical protein M378DRAFT_11472 [Amanita muscaria Koide BX008]
MAPTTKTKSKATSASSFLELKAELAKKEEELSKLKAAGQSTSIQGAKRSEKKPSVWARQNKGVGSRAARDIELEAVDRPTLESARAVLERKAKIYDKLKKGKTGGLSENQYSSLLVDFDSKPLDAYESDSDDVDESLTVPKPPTHEEDPIVEYEDEFGRIRTARRSEVPRNLLPPEPDEDEDIVIRNPVNHFPVYTPSEDRIAEIEKTFAEDNNPLNIHFNATKENRAMGAGFYQFSADEETRRAQMEEFKATRDETTISRQEAGAVDLKPGEVEGMRSGEVAKSRAMEKRKREIEERRALIEAKRKKVKVEGSAEPKPPSETPAAAPAPTQREQQSSFVADPFAALEAETPPQAPQKKGKEKGKGKGKSTEVDSFLAQLGKDLLASRTK